MPRLLTKIWIHVIFSTKDRQPLIQKEYCENIYRRVVENFEKQGCHVQIINGTADHVHILILLIPEKSLTELIKTAKSVSSHWINRQEYMEPEFAWQTGYSAFSVSESQVELVEDYIRNQIEHHRQRSYQEEVDLFVRKYGLE